MGVKPFYKHFKHNGVNGPNMATVYSDRGQGVRAPVVFYNRSNEAAAQLKPGDFDWKRDLRGRRALVPQRRHLRGALGDHGGSDHRRHAGGQGGRRGGLVRPELPRQAVEHLGRRRTGGGGARPHREERGRAGRQRRGSAEGAGHSGAGSGRELEARPERVLRHDRQGGQETPAGEDGGHHAARGALHQPAQLGRGGVDRRADLHVRRRRTGCVRPRGRRRRVRRGLLLRPAHRRSAGGSA